jgi:hypothetical protein
MALLQPFVILFVCGHIISVSTSWLTELQPLFIITNIMISFLFLHTKRWTLPAILLITLTSFSVEFYPIFHTWVAVLFFVSCLYPILREANFGFYTILYLLALPIGYYYGLFLMEMWAINVLCLHHFRLIWLFKNLSHKTG